MKTLFLLLSLSGAVASPPISLPLDVCEAAFRDRGLFVAHFARGNIRDQEATVDLIERAGGAVQYVHSSGRIFFTMRRVRGIPMVRYNRVL